MTAQERIFVSGLHTASEHGLHPQEQFTRIEGLDHIIVRPQLEAHDAVHVVAARREHDDGDMFGTAVLAQFAAYGQTVQTGKHNIQQDERRTAAARQLQSGCTIGGFQSFISFTLQIEDQQLADICFVIDNENELAHMFLCCSGRRHAKRPFLSIRFPGWSQYGIKVRKREDCHTIDTKLPFYVHAVFLMSYFMREQPDLREQNMLSAPVATERSAKPVLYPQGLASRPGILLSVPGRFAFNSPRSPSSAAVIPPSARPARFSPPFPAVLLRLL